MDAYEDTLEAFDDLIAWLRQDPHVMPSGSGDRYVTMRQPGEYDSALARRSQRVAQLMNHLLQDGLRIPNDYSWRRFRETMESGCQFDTGYGQGDGEKERQEILRVVRTARDNLVQLRSPKPSRQAKPTISTPVRSDEAVEYALTKDTAKPKKRRDNVGYGWPAKIAFAGVGLAAWVWAYPRLAALAVPSVEHNTSYALGLIASSLTVFFGLIALANIVRKP